MTDGEAWAEHPQEWCIVFGGSDMRTVYRCPKCGREESVLWSDAPGGCGWQAELKCGKKCKRVQLHGVRDEYKVRVR